MRVFDMSDRILKNPEMIETVIDGDFFILDPDKHAYYTLNEVGVSIWRFISSQATTFKGVCDYLHEQYGLEQRLCMQHARLFLESMVVKKVILLSEANASFKKT